MGHHQVSSVIESDYGNLPGTILGSKRKLLLGKATHTHTHADTRTHDGQLELSTTQHHAINEIWKKWLMIAIKLN